MRSILVALFLVCMSSPAAAVDCTSWRKVGPDQQEAKVENLIAVHVNNHMSKRYTSENRAAIKRCLDRFAEQIAGEFDAICGERPGASEGVLDDIFDRYLLSCIQ